jgi:hypothetical protein
MTSASEKGCEGWLRAEMRQGPPSKNRDEYETEARTQFPGTSSRGFKRAWDAAKQKTKARGWGEPGRKSKRRIDTPVKS